MTKTKTKLTYSKVRQSQAVGLRQDRSQAGQVLLAILVSMTVALAIGVGVSIQTITGLSGITSSDSYQRAKAAAEGGAESALVLSEAQLADYVASPPNSQDQCQDYGFDYDATLGVCAVILGGGQDNGTQDPVFASAAIAISNFKFTNPVTETYDFALTKNNVKQVNLDGYSGEIDICWGMSGTDKADLYLIVMGADSISDRKLIQCTGGPCNSSWEFGSAAEQASGDCGTAYQNKYTLSVVSGAKSLRLFPLGGNAIARVKPHNAGAFPNQGYKIKSTARLINAGASETATVSVYKSYLYSVGLFDIGVYAGSMLK